MVPPKPFKKYYDGKCSHSTFSMPKAKTITQIRPNDQNKGERKAQIQSRGSNFGTYTSNSVLKYLILLLQHPSKLKYF